MKKHAFELTTKERDSVNELIESCVPEYCRLKFCDSDGVIPPLCDFAKLPEPTPVDDPVCGLWREVLRTPVRRGYVIAVCLCAAGLCGLMLAGGLGWL